MTAPPARGLVGQLPLTLDVEPFGSNEQTFYPPEALDCSDAPLAEGGAGVLAYYEPWGDVVMFYDGFSGNGSLYELGRATAGAGERGGHGGDHRSDARIAPRACFSGVHRKTYF